MEVYCWDRNDWLLYGFGYKLNGDSVVIDFESKKRKKYTIVDFDEGEQPSPCLLYTSIVVGENLSCVDSEYLILMMNISYAKEPCTKALQERQKVVAVER